MHDPEWLEGYFEGQIRNLFLYSLYDASSLCGLAPFLLREWPLKWYLGELAIAKFPLRRLRLLGGPPVFPAKAPAYDALFSEIAKSDVPFDMLHLEEIPIESFLWDYLNHSKLIDKLFLRYQPEPPSPHPILRFSSSFEQYMGKFNSKHRKNLRRTLRKLHDKTGGDMRLTRFDTPEQVASFLEQAVEVSRKTYQWILHERGLSAIDLLRRRLLFAAERGWMRSYLLYCGGKACAFLVGFQYRGRFLLDEIGFDPTWTEYSVGTVLQLLAIEDLFNHNRPNIFDLQDYAPYKEALSTESYLQSKMFLFRRGPYSRLLRAGHYACQLSTRTLSSGLARLGWKSKVKKLLRGRAGS